MLVVFIISYFTFFLTELLLCINPQLKGVSLNSFGSIFFTLFVYYGLVYIALFFLFYFIYRIFSEQSSRSGLKKFFGSVAFVNFIALFFFVLNFKFYRSFLNNEAKEIIFKIIFLQILLIVLFFLFLIFKKVYRQVALIMMIMLLIFQVFYSFFITTETKPEKEQPGIQKKPFFPLFERKLKIIVFQGMGLDTLLSFVSEEKLLNFKFIKENGAYGYIANHKPAFTTSLLATVLSGESPEKHQRFTDIFFQVRGSDEEFQNWPRYILFRNMEHFKMISFYRHLKYSLPDKFNHYFSLIKKKSFAVYPSNDRPKFSQKSLKRNKTFQRFFLEWDEDNGLKINLLKKAFFYDDYIRKIFFNHRDENNYYYFVYFPGMELITSHFYHYAFPEIFSQEKIDANENYRYVLERYYQFYDSILGAALANLKSNELLCVISLNEPEILPLWRRFIANFFGSRDVYMYNSASGRGVFFLFEKNAVRHNTFIEFFPIKNFFLTLLYYLGFPLPKNLDGEVSREIFIEKFLTENPVYFQ